MADLVIDAVDLLDCRNLVGPGDDPFIVQVRAGTATGWYGPVRADVATTIGNLRACALGTPISDHTGLASRLARSQPGPADDRLSWAIGALDCAVWDLHAHAEGVSVAELLGATGSPATVPAYASLLTLDVHDDDNNDRISEIAADGWAFTKWSLRPAADLDVGSDAERLATTVQRVRNLIGVAAAFDALWAWSEPLTRHFGELIDAGDVLWLEEPHPHHSAAGYATVRRGTPVGLGERLRYGEDPDVVLSLPTLAAFTVDVVGCGGLTAAVQLVHRARAVGVPVYPHGRSLLPAVHLAAAFPGTVPAVEYQLQWQPRRDRLVHHPVSVNAGQLAIARPTGFGPTPRSS